MFQKYSLFFAIQLFISANSNTSVGAHTTQLLVCGGLAGMTSAIFCYPLDLARVYLTVQTSDRNYTGTLKRAVWYFEERGVVL